ncbi:MAG: thiamine ABC transporter substrate-binding protein [Spirochaetes bacterium]|nr:thiamine ABC transporter substrate-binding protein [Spirochaetota bacterium]
MKQPAILPFLLFVLLAFCACAKPAEAGDPSKLVVYVYDSFAAEWGPGPAIVKGFLKASGIEIELVSSGDAGQTLVRAILEKKTPKADVIVGIDNNLAHRAISEGILLSYRPSGAGKVPPELVLDPEWRLTPFDWGCFAIVWDSEKLESPPKDLEGLTSPEYSGKLVIMDPRTSTPGLGFLAWTVSAYGDAAPDYWRRLKPTVLTMTDGWDSAYGMFVAGETPLVLSYTTSPAYHVENDHTERYKTLVFAEGHPLQVEGAGILAGTMRLKQAKAFVDYLLSPEVQALLPTTQWMYPVDPSIPLPASFKAAPRPAKLLKPEAAVPVAMIDACLEALGRK